MLKAKYKKDQSLLLPSRYKDKINHNNQTLTTACHVGDLNAWLEKDLVIFRKYLKHLELPRPISKKILKLYPLFLISYNAIDSIADAESDPKDLNLFLSMFLEFKIIFDDLSKQSSETEFLENLFNSVNRQYLQCANDPSSISFSKIQGIRSVPYILPFVLALTLSNKKNSVGDIIKCCFCFCSIRQTSDDLKDLEDDIKNSRTTLPTLLYSWQIKPGATTVGATTELLSDDIKLKIAEKSLEFCKGKLEEIKVVLEKNKKGGEQNILGDKGGEVESGAVKKESINTEIETETNPVLIIINHWYSISSKITFSIEKYCEILAE